MIEEKNQTLPLRDQAERAKWEKPEMRRIDTSEAEAAAGAGLDVVFS